LVNKFLSAKIAPPGADPSTARSAINRWLDDIAGRATVRISLAGQRTGTGCGCCSSKKGQAPRSSDISENGCAASYKTAASDAGKAADAGLRFWYAKHGLDSVTARLTDYGCHIQIDIVKNEKIIGSLRYQDGSITEM